MGHTEKLKISAKSDSAVGFLNILTELTKEEKPWFQGLGKQNNTLSGICSSLDFYLHHAVKI